MPRNIALLLILTATAAGIASAAISLRPARVVARITTGKGPCSENGGLGYLWVSNAGDASIARIDPSTNKVTGRVKVGKGPCGIAISDDALWIDGYGTNTLERVDPATLQVVARIPIGPSFWDVAYRCRCGLGNQRVRRHRKPRRSCDERDPRDDQGRHGSASGAVRSRCDLGRREQREKHLSCRSDYEQGKGGSRLACSHPTRSRSATPPSG